jgi:hypothetical protein
VNAQNHTDILSIIVFGLFLIRCVCGIVQTTGVYLLNTLQQQQQQQQQNHCATTLSLSSSSHTSDNDDEEEDNGTTSSDEEDHDLDGTTTVLSFIASSNPHHRHPQQQQLRSLHARINVLFYYLFIPIMVVYIAMSVSYHHHDGNSGMCFVEPNISPMIPSTMPTASCSGTTTNNNNNSSMNDEQNGMGFMLMPNIPGLGMYFHFGLVLLLFIYDGIQRTVPTYAPSLFLATISTYHLALVLGTDVLLWDALQTQLYTSISFTNLEIVQRVVQVLWLLVSGYLAYSLHQFWNLRVTALHE